MTLLVHLDGRARPPSRPTFVTPVNDPATFTSRVVRSIVKARRIAVVCGAGISVQAGIPDFRSSDGLFQRIKRENPKENLSSGKDLFDASVFSAEHTTALFCQMIARLSRLSLDAAPTPFHNILRDLDDKGKLLRVYTQNIDALEEKAGLSFGLPIYASRSRNRAKTGKASDDSQLSAAAQVLSYDQYRAGQTADGEGTAMALQGGSSEIPRCIPLHGTLQSMHCVSCNHAYPLSDHSDCLDEGSLPDCPDCTFLEETRSMIGKRQRGIGKLRPSVVLYNEDHSNGEGVGEAVRRDLLGRSGADLLIVVGTSLRVPGTKRIVREFAKSVKAKEKARAERAHEVAWSKRSLPTPTPSPSSTPSPSPRRTPVGGSESSATPSPPPLPDLPPEERPITTVYVNLDFPVPTREWDNVFDVWVQGDAQVFAELVRTEMDREERERAEKLEREERAREERKEREEQRRRRKEEKERIKREIEAAKACGGLKKARKKKRAANVEGKVEKKKRVTLHVKKPHHMHPTPRSLTKIPRSGCSNYSNETYPSERIIVPSPTFRRPSSPSKMRLNILSSLASQSPHVYRRRSVPDIVSPVSHNRHSSSSPRHSNHDPKGKGKEVQRDSALDLLADAAATLAIAPPSGGNSLYTFDSFYQRSDLAGPSKHNPPPGSGVFDYHSYAVHNPAVYHPASPPASRSHSHIRTRPVLIPSREQHLDSVSFGSLLSPVSSLTPSPSPVMDASSPPYREFLGMPPKLVRPYSDKATPGPSVKEWHCQPTPDNPLSPSTSAVASFTPDYQRPRGHRSHPSNGAHTPSKRKPDSSFTSPKAPTKVKKVKLNIRKPDAHDHSDVEASPKLYDTGKDNCQDVSPKSSSDQSSLDSPEFHNSDPEADVPLMYTLPSSRQEVLCN